MIMRDKQLEQRIKELEEFYECPINSCDRKDFTKRGLFLHLRARHSDYYYRVCWNKDINYVLESLKLLSSTAHQSH